MVNLDNVFTGSHVRGLPVDELAEKGSGKIALRHLRIFREERSEKNVQTRDKIRRSYAEDRIRLDRPNVWCEI